MIDGYTELAPNLKASVIARQVIGPYDMEQELGLIGGNIFHGELSVDQLFHMRPAPGYADYRTPLWGLYHGSSATHAGGGVIGIPGWQAFRQAKADLDALRIAQLAPGPADVPRDAPGDGTAGDPASGPRLDAGGPLGGRRRRQRQGGLARPPDDDRARRGGFDGHIYPVNPRYDEVDGYRVACARPARCPSPWTWRSSAWRMLESRRRSQTLRRRGRGAPRRSRACSRREPIRTDPPTARLAAIANEHAMAFCGGNGMGFINLEAGLRATGFPTPDELRRGPVAFISHSGSAFAAMAFNDRGIGFNLIVSSGQEIVTSVGEYVEYALGLDSTRVIGLFLETVREPERFRAALELAAARAVPVIALKVGRAEGNERDGRGALGALAGEDGAYEALFDAHGVHRVSSLDEMADTMELFSCPRRVTTGNGIASVHDSGGERVLFVDLRGRRRRASGSDIGCDGRSHPGRARSRPRRGEPTGRVGTGIDHERIFLESFEALHADLDTAAAVTT